MNDILNELSIQIADQILKEPGRKILPDQKLISTGLIDSFNLVGLALMVEDLFDVRIDDSELNADTFDTLNDLVGLIQSRKE